MKKPSIKSFLGELPLTAEFYWLLRQRGKPTTVGLSLRRLKKVLPDWTQQSVETRQNAQPGKKVLTLGMLRFWIEHTTLVGLALAGLGHEVTLAYLPYSNWKRWINRFDLRRQNIFIRNTLSPIKPAVDVLSLMDVKVEKKYQLPPKIAESMQARAYRDTQYSMLVEEVETDSDLYRLRLSRNTSAARKMLVYLESNRPDVIITPNGSILEFGVLYEIARYLDIPVITYEFGEQDNRIWMAQNADVMRQETGDLWEARGKLSLTEAERERIRTMFSTRQGAQIWETFARQWQGTPSRGGEQSRADLGLDSRPLAFLPTNVLGDSLTLGRDIFTGMTAWLRQTIRYFIDHPEFQLVIRVHPGEQIGWGPSVYDILTDDFPKLPENIQLLSASAKVNSYDLVEAAEVGLVYTTTMGMEMAMSGLPVIVTGQTHYRDKGFTLDPNSWDEFHAILETVLNSPEKSRPSNEQIELAWTYAYRFFFEYPQPFPWHLLHYWDKMDDWSISWALSPEGLARFGPTFNYLAGEPIEWNNPTAYREEISS